MVLRERIELSTSPLPRECSTTELPQQENHFRAGFATLFKNWQEGNCIYMKKNSIVLICLEFFPC